MEFGCRVIFRVSGKVQGGLMQERWFPGFWLGRELHTSENLVMKEDGLVVRSRAVREISGDTTMADLDRLQSTPRDPTDTIRAAERPATSVPRAPLPTPGDDGDKSAPGRVKITRGVVERLGPSRDWQRCRAIQCGDPGYEAVGHSPTCRARMEELMKKDPSLQARLAGAEERRQKFLADYVEKRDALQQRSDESAPKRRREEASESAGAALPDPLGQASVSKVIWNGSRRCQLEQYGTSEFELCGWPQLGRKRG